MGQFSWCCAQCDQEVMHGPQPGYEWTTDAAIVWPNGDRRSGRYEDGYGNIAGVDLVDQGGDWRLVHQRCFETVKHLSTAEMFDGFKKEKHASDQGWWPGERIALERYGEPDHFELTKVQTYVCYECNRTWEATWSGGVCPFGCVRPKNYRDTNEEAVSRGWGDHHELVEPFRYTTYDLGVADGVILCHNEYEERTDWEKYHAQRKAGVPEDLNKPTKIEPCFYFGQPQQARVTKPDDWDEETAYMNDGVPKPFVIQCKGCKSDNVEIVPLTKAVKP